MAEAEAGQVVAAEVGPMLILYQIELRHFTFAHAALVLGRVVPGHGGLVKEDIFQSIVSILHIGPLD